MTWVGCTLEPMARGSPQGEHELGHQHREARMKVQVPISAAAERRYVRRVSAAIDQPRDAAPRRRRGRFSTGIEQRPDAPDKLRRGSFADGYDPAQPTASRLRNS
jgi:hypothetical protein